ncbi:MAG TPA: hypothetical protein VF172_12040 [Nitrososphaera sp.]
MVEGIALPVVAGLAIGIGFIVVLFVALDPPASRFLTDITPEEQALIDKARQQEAVRLFLANHYFAREGLVNRDPLVEYDENGNIASSDPAITVGYVAPARTTVVYGGASLIRYEYPSLHVVIDLDGNVRQTELLCGISYLGNPSGFVSSVMGQEDVLKLLRDNALPC